MSGKHECDFLIALDIDDETMNNELVRDCIAQMDDSYERAKVDYYYKDHTGTVDAVNTDIASRDFDIVMAISDDIIPTKANYDEVVVDAMTASFPDLDGAIYFRDGHRVPSMATIPIMGRTLYRQRGHFFDPAFLFGGADRDLSIILNGTGKLTYFPELLFRHTWKQYGGDHTYSRSRYQRRLDFYKWRDRHTAGYYNAYLPEEQWNGLVKIK